MGIHLNVAPILLRSTRDHDRSSVFDFPVPDHLLNKETARRDDWTVKRVRS